MVVAIPLLMLVALVGLLSLAALVFGIVYAIANKRPGLALGSVLAPVAIFFGAGLLAMTFWSRLNHARVEGPMNAEPAAHVSWSEIPPIPAMPAMPPMPAIGPGPVHLDPDLAIWGVVALVGFICLVAMFRKRSSGEGRPRRGMSLAVMAAMAVGVFAAVQSSRHSSHGSASHADHSERAAEAQRAIDDQIRHDQQAVQANLLKSQRLTEEAKDKAARALFEGKSFQEMFEKLNQPRIQLASNNESATKTVEGATLSTAEISTSDGKTKFVVPISERTQESLARSVERLEQMVEQVSDVADQVSDAGTLLGKAMVALNERIDKRSKTAVGPAHPTPAVEAMPVKVEMTAERTTNAIVETEARPVRDAEAGIELEDLATNTIEVTVSQKKLDQIGLTFEKLKEILSREGLWHGTVVRFDADKFQISTKGRFEDDYVPRLLNTLVFTYGRDRTPIHLRDIAEAKALRPLPIASESESSRPSWIDKLSRQVGNSRWEVVVTDEYSSPEECARAADVYLLLKTYEHFSQLLGNPRSDAPMPTLSFHESGAITADGKVIYEKSGDYGTWTDSRIRKLADMGIGIDFVRREMVTENREYYESIEHDFGTMKKLYTMLEFRPNVDKEMLRRWDELRRGERFAVVGAGAGSVLGLLGLAFGLLKADTLTKGYYTKRLFLGVPAAIIGTLALLGLAAG